MSQLIDLCGTPIQLDKVKNFRLVKRDYLFYPAYQEVQSFSASVFARFGSEGKKKFQFVQMVPFGAVLGDKEKPRLDGYEIKDFSEALGLSLLDSAGSALASMGTMAADILRINTSGQKMLRILTPGRRLVKMRLRDIPAKVAFLSGKVADVYKNDQIYPFLGEPISPTITPVQTLVITVDKTTYAFFGNGIDMEDAESVYQSLLEAYNTHLASISEKKRLEFPKINLHIPKLNLPFLTATSKPAQPTIASDSFEEEPSLPIGMSLNDQLVQGADKAEQETF